MAEDGSFTAKTVRGDARRIWQGMFIEPEGPVFARLEPKIEGAAANIDPVDADDETEDDEP